MNILDILIIVFVLFGAVLGFKRGFTKEVVKTLGFIAVIVLAYLFKNPLSVFLYEKLPFFKFGMLKSIGVLNILVYELLAFIICIIGFSILLKVLLFATTIFEKILNATVILGIPSKICGAVVGVVYNYIFAFIILYILSTVFVGNEFVVNSSFRKPILEQTPLLSFFIEKSNHVIDEFIVLKDKYNDSSISEDEFNYQAMDLFLKYDVIAPDTLQKLIANGKITSFENCLDLINKYKENNNGN